MMRRRLLWTLSAVMLLWLVASSWHTRRIENCVGGGGRWVAAKWTCEPGAGRIILERGLKRSRAPADGRRLTSAPRTR